MEGNNNKGDSSKDIGKEISFHWFFVSFLIHWKWFVLSVVVFLAGGYIHLRYAIRVYSVSSTILLKDSRRGGLGNSEASIYEAIGFLEPNRIIENEIAVLRSRDILEEVVIEEELFVSYEVKGKFKNTDIYGGAAGFYVTPPVKVYMEKSTISSLYRTIYLVVSLTDNSTVKVDGHNGYETVDYEFNALPAVIKTPIGDLLLLQDAYVSLKKEHPVHITVVPPVRKAQEYIGRLSANNIDKNSTIVNLTLSETNRKRGEVFFTSFA